MARQSTMLAEPHRPRRFLKVSATARVRERISGAGKICLKFTIIPIPNRLTVELERTLFHEDNTNKKILHYEATIAEPRSSRSHDARGATKLAEPHRSRRSYVVRGPRCSRNHTARGVV